MLRTASLFSAYIVELLLMAAAYAFVPSANAEAATAVPQVPLLIE